MYVCQGQWYSYDNITGRPGNSSLSLLLQKQKVTGSIHRDTPKFALMDRTVSIKYLWRYWRRHEKEKEQIYIYCLI